MQYRKSGWLILAAIGACTAVGVVRAASDEEQIRAMKVSSDTGWQIVHENVCVVPKRHGQGEGGTTDLALAGSAVGE